MPPATLNYSSPTSTADSGADGRLKVSVSQNKGKKAIIRKYLKNYK